MQLLSDSESVPGWVTHLVYTELLCHLWSWLPCENALQLNI